ncbi:MAG TPA: hypothetical protein IAA04_12475 [Candidatus Lachnoclostridium pullistercoris]|uniref:Uncharacterized protein n=1 Tax=Candidatus Lachnoclostridium pullistercoris TaxID=2838632 RepID=A0A9D2T8D1_9FIRM|nr:hypothetical protein [Candidatus Lachnoclostridium pullistercoris]
MNRTAAVLLAAVLAAGLPGCGGQSSGNGAFEPSESSVYISGDGTVSSAFVENYDKDYYTEDSLKAFLEEEIAGEYADVDVTLKECSVADGVMKAVFDYGSPEDLTKFLADQKSENLDITGFSVRTVEEGIADGTVADGVFTDVRKGEPADLKTLARESDGYLVTVDGTASVQAAGEIRYVSDGVEVSGKTARAAGEPAYIIITR